MCNSKKMVELFRQAKDGEITFNEMFEESMPTIKGILKTLHAEDEITSAYLVLAKMLASQNYYEGEMAEQFQVDFQAELRKELGRNKRHVMTAALQSVRESELADDGGIGIDAKKEAANIINRVMEEKLSARQVQILTMIYGLNGNVQHKVIEVARYYGCDTYTIERLRNSALDTLRVALEEAEVSIEAALA